MLIFYAVRERESADLVLVAVARILAKSDHFPAHQVITTACLAFDVRELERIRDPPLMLRPQSHLLSRQVGVGDAGSLHRQRRRAAQPVSNIAACKATTTAPVAAAVFAITRRMTNGVNMAIGPVIFLRA